MGPLILSPTGPETHVRISACTADLDPSASTTNNTRTTDAVSYLAEGVQQIKIMSYLQLSSSGTLFTAHAIYVTAVPGAASGNATLSDLISAPGCNEIVHGYSGTSVVGVYVAQGLANQGPAWFCPLEAGRWRRQRRGEDACPAVRELVGQMVTRCFRQQQP
jgi:hypothetical protein